jgi:hypothetical protein
MPIGRTSAHARLGSTLATVVRSIATKRRFIATLVAAMHEPLGATGR